ncbi:AAA family ATPase, partial [Lactobacillus helveticus]
MWIKRLFIEGFKGFEKDFILDLTPDKNIIIGKNGVGKTTILQAINLVLQQRGVVTFGNGSLSYANYINNAILNSSLSKA